MASIAKATHEGIILAADGLIVALVLTKAEDINWDTMNTANHEENINPKSNMVKRIKITYTNASTPSRTTPSRPKIIPTRLPSD
ncbi:hypothetical protein H0H87_001932 [Tephrocybe sp. NHM501043]|nr:hypothetical protein H0H87_001932 [Tephrocybe sp. NHM501043]